MDLKIAYIKYTRGFLMSSQMPVIATEALMNGYDSTSLVLLASEYEPTMAKASSLFEAAMYELDIQIPIPANSTDTNLPGPLSTQSPEFSEPVLKALEQNNELIVQQRFANTGGAGAGWYVIKRVADWRELLASGKAKTAYTVILERELPTRGIANDQLKNKAVQLFDGLGDLMIGIITEGDSHMPLYSFEWDPRTSKPKDAEKDLANAKEKINRFFEKHQGKQMAIGRDLWIWEEDIAQITGYIPNADGVARPGAY